MPEFASILLLLCGVLLGTSATLTMLGVVLGLRDNRRRRAVGQLGTLGEQLKRTGTLR